MLLNLFSPRPDHPLADAKELKRVLSELPVDNAYRAVDEIHGWFESLQVVPDFRADLLFDVVRQLDEATQPHLRRMARDYLHSPGLSKNDERRLSAMFFAYWGEVANLYTRCLDAARQGPKDKVAEALASVLPLIAARLVAARGRQLKWTLLRYEPIGAEIWRALGLAYLVAESAGVAQKPVQLYPGQSGVTSVQQQYLHPLILYSSSMDSLIPLEIELADRLLEHAQGTFAFATQRSPDCAYWVDAAAAMPPVRLDRPPDSVTPGVRFFGAGSAPPIIDGLLLQIERGDVPKDLNLGGEYHAHVVLPVLRHLAWYWAPEPPQREHRRHAVKTRMAVLQGFDDCFTVFAGELAKIGKERNAETWVVENVSQGGFGIAVPEAGSGLHIGGLLALQPDGGDNWLLGVVRRFSRDSEGRVQIGVQCLAKNARSIELLPRASGFAATAAIPAIWLGDGEAPDEMRVVQPTHSFDLRQGVEVERERQRLVLAPIELEQSGAGFEIGRYRVRAES